MPILAHPATSDRTRTGRTSLLRGAVSICVAILLSSILPSAPKLQAQNVRRSAPEVEAAYLFNFGKFIRWPQTVRNPDAFMICVLGEDPFGPVLDKTVSGEAIDGKKVVTRHIAHPQEATSCSILYISPSESGRLNRILPAVKNLPILTVSDIPDFLERGGTIQFVMRGGRVRFEVNLEPTETDGLTLSSELLKVASNVKGNQRQESQ